MLNCALAMNTGSKCKICKPGFGLHGSSCFLGTPNCTEYNR